MSSGFEGAGSRRRSAYVGSFRTAVGSANRAGRRTIGHPRLHARPHKHSQQGCFECFAGIARSEALSHPRDSRAHAGCGHDTG